MKNIFKALIIVALLMPLFLFNNVVKAETTKETVNDLIVTYGENLLPLTDEALTYKDGVLKTKNKIYYPNKYGEDYGLSIIIPYGSFNTAYTATIKFYDIDFTFVGSETIDYFMDLPMEGSYDSVWGSIATIPDGAFSFSLEITGLNKTVTLSNLGIMVLDSDMDFFTDYKYKYISYIPTRGFMGLLEEIKPTIVLSYKTTYTAEYIAGLVDVIDACEGDIKEYYTVDSSAYLNSKTKVGKYAIDIKFNNEVVGSFYIEVEDKIAPVIEGPDSIDIPAKTTINKAYLESKGFLFSDEYDSENSKTTSLVITNSLGDTASLGTGTLKLTLVDSNNNQKEKTVSIKIIDTVAPLIEIVNKNLEISYEYILGVDTLIEKAFTITDDYSSNPTIRIVQDGYTANSRKVGTYTVKVEAEDDYENISSETFTVTVFDNIPPVIFLNTYRIETDVTVKLSKDDIVQTLMNAGILKKEEKYTVSVITDNYTGNESTIGLYQYQLRCDSSTETILKTLEINVSDIGEYGGNVVTQTATIENESEDRTILIIASSSLIIGGGSLIFIFRKRKRIIKPKRF